MCLKLTKNTSALFRTRSSMEALRLPLRFRSVFAQGKLLTSNWTEELKILSIGEIVVHPLYGMDNNLSIKSIESVLSAPIAPLLHQKFN